MRTPFALLLAALLAFSLAGCASNEPSSLDEPSSSPLTGAQFEGAPDQGAPAGSRSPHGDFTREDGAVETGNDGLQQIPAFWARQAITITNSFSGADHAVVALDIDAGSIQVRPSSEDGYRIEALLEGRGATEQDARDSLARLHLEHADEMKPDGLHLDTRTRRDPETSIVPFAQVNVGGGWSEANLVVYLPASPSYSLSAQASSGDVSVSDLRGSFTAGASSGDVLLSGLNARHIEADTSSGDLSLDGVQADRAELGASSGDISAKGLRIHALTAETSSGSMTLEGLIDTMEVDASSGDISVDAHGRQSGAYKVGASSGSIVMHLLSGEGRAYRITADTSSGTVSVDVPNSRQTGDSDEDGRHAEVESRDYDEARIRTVVDLSTSSGDISVDG